MMLSLLIFWHGIKRWILPSNLGLPDQRYQISRMKMYNLGSTTEERRVKFMFIANQVRKSLEIRRVRRWLRRMKISFNSLSKKIHWLNNFKDCFMKKVLKSHKIQNQQIRIHLGHKLLKDKKLWNQIYRKVILQNRQ